MKLFSLFYQNKSTELMENETILDGLEKLGIIIPWQCRQVRPASPATF